MLVTCRRYAVIKTVPPGRVTTYKAVAAALSCGSNQAVGQALRRCVKGVGSSGSSVPRLCVSVCVRLCSHLTLLMPLATACVGIRMPRSSPAIVSYPQA